MGHMGILADIKDIKSTPKELKEFGYVVGGVLLALGTVSLWRGKPAGPYMFGLGAFLALCGAVMPRVLLPLQKAWMSLAVAMGFVMSKVVLFIVFFGMVTPIGFILKLTGKDILDEKLDRRAGTYWHDVKDAYKPKESYTKQF